MESEFAFQGSFLGLMLPAGDQKDSQLLHPQRIYLCVNGQVDCAKSRRFQSLDELDGLLRTFGSSQNQDTFFSNATFAQEVCTERSWDALKNGAREQLERLIRNMVACPEGRTSEVLDSHSIDFDQGIWLFSRAHPEARY